MVYRLNYQALRSKYVVKSDLSTAKRRIAKRFESAEYLAYLYWGVPTLWPVLALVNQLDDPLHIPVGKELIIPNYDQAYAEFARLYLEYRTV